MRNEPIESPRFRTPQKDDTVDTLAMLRLLLRGWPQILTALAVCLAGGLLYLFVLATPQYVARSTVILDPRKPQLIDLASVIGGMSGEADELNSEVEVLRSRGLLNKVVDTLDLASDPEFNPRLSAPSPVARLVGAILPASETPSAQQLRDSTVTTLISHLRVRILPSSYVFEIAVRSEDPEKAARISDTIAQLYIRDQIEVKFQATEAATEWLTERVGTLKQDLEAAEARLKAFDAESALISPVTLGALEMQLKDIRDRLGRIRHQRDAGVTYLEALAAARTPVDRRAAAADPVLDRIAPAASTAFDARFAEIVAQAEQEVTRTEDQIAALETSELTLREQIARQSEDMIEIQQLTREAEASRMLYEYFLNRLKETSAQQGIQQADSRVLSQAVIPETPASPRAGLVLGLCLALGLITGAALSAWRELRNSAFRTARELEAASGTLVMGQIPLIKAHAKSEMKERLTARPASPAMEAVRNLRTSLMLSNVDAPPQVIVTTSALPGEGKTTTAIALAVNLALSGKAVLLVEGDIRRRTLSEYFPQDAGAAGLSSVLSGQIPLEEAVRRDEASGLSLLMGDEAAANAADLFASAAYRHFLEAARAHYDHVIIDTPPVLVVPDARIQAQAADAVLFAVRWNVTTQSQLEDALHMFTSVNRPVTGLVLTQIDRAKMRRYASEGPEAPYGSYAAYG
ncbi:GumC family protein [Thioclava atlantica]|uniref:non-specific protein-tyrosine kinase n=1 Tax=Thioclava atlantica TaxID=1317124 RepID=A0A085TXY4_9RHOB|nr:polysaccharide biosynthesis tyrosine autokinase [Thioclava atlantica]KFE35581.1 lipopolysaccharide biosynthesis family protein [Thioclava atlantica]